MRNYKVAITEEVDIGRSTYSVDTDGQVALTHTGSPLPPETINERLDFVNLSYDLSQQLEVLMDLSEKLDRRLEHYANLPRK